MTGDQQRYRYPAISISLLDEEKELVKAAAGRIGISMAAFAREAVLTAARTVREVPKEK